MKRPGSAAVSSDRERIDLSHSVRLMYHNSKIQGVRFQSLTEQVGTTHPLGEAMLQWWECSLKLERTKAGQQVDKRQRVKFGPKHKRSAAHIVHARQLIDHNNKAPSEVATRLNVSRMTLW